MKPWQKRLLRGVLAVAGIAANLTAFPETPLAWVQSGGAWMTLIILAMWSNSDFAKKEKL